ncbi:MAG: SDR family NAD(P)-dependent oxidoreductase [Actinomycetota bacterium]|nr:SDR family NAD(P)-dependent oxidoreductase [Actinomycetota bacterium]
MDLGLEGKVALITGASRGIGRAIALAFAREGAAVVATARSRDDLDETVQAMAGNQHCAVVADVTDPDRIAAAVDEATSTLGPIDIVVNNAGQRQDFGRLDELDVEEWRRVLEANLSSAFYVARAVVPGMIERRTGSIVNIASIAGPVGFGRIGAYTAAKAGLIALTKVMAVEWTEYGIRANAVAPGWTESPMNLELRTEPENRELFESIRDTTLLKRFGVPREVADVVVFLAGSPSSYITGETVTVDGGWLAV